MFSLDRNELVFRFPGIHRDAVCRIGFQRTLRLPDDGREYPLPPGLGLFPLRRVAAHAHRLPRRRAARGGVFLPLWQAEALWIGFDSAYPMAVQVATGALDAHADARVLLLNSRQYRAATGAGPPIRPPGAEDYSRAGLPWFEYYADDVQAIEDSRRLAGLRSIGLS